MSGSTETGRTDVRTSLREMWATRPVRSDTDRLAVGVAGAIARRYAVDPTLVRVAFVVLALSGGGLVLYLAGWAALPPDPADPPRRGRAHRRPGTPGRRPRGGPPVALLVVLGVVALATVGPGAAGRFTGVVGVVVALVLLVTLHSGRAPLGVVGARGVPVGGDPTSRAPEDGEPTADAPRPPGWDPLGAAPFAWDLPEPAAPPVPRSRLTPLTLAVALLVAGGIGVLDLTGVVDASAATIAASALAVVGLGLLVAAFRPGGRRLLVVAVPLAVITVLSAGGLGGGFGDRGSAPGGAGDVVAAPATAALVAPEYRTGLGDVDLDLRTAAATGPVRTRVDTGVGDVTVLVPTTADVTVSCRTAVGDVDCLGATGSSTRLVDPGPDGPGGPLVDLDLSSDAGNLAVRRG